MKKLNEKQKNLLKNEYERDKRKKFLVMLAVTIAFLASALLFYAFSWSAKIQNGVEGIAREIKVTTYHNEGVKIYMKVELKNGERVNVLISNHQLFKKDHELILSKRTPSIGLPSYSFLKYKNQ